MGVRRDFDDRLTSLEVGLRLLPDKPEETLNSTLRALWMKAAGFPMSAERAGDAPLPDLDRSQLEELDRMINLRLSGVPLGHLTGRQLFLGLDLIVGPGALLPRRETEILAKAAAEVVAELMEVQGRVLMVDTCCGSGNVALAVAHGAPRLNAIGVDLSAEAVELARLNARHLDLDDRVEFRTGDLLSPIQDFAGGVDVITCNPPYISTAKVREMAQEISLHEPEMAFDGGPFGIRVLHRLITEAPAMLRPQGYLVFEVGLGQGDAMLARIQKQGAFESCESYRDESGSTRAVRARLG